ncbi:MAG TPA: hypothetical protein PLT45_08930 [Smithella sp.]|nr:hypothetical protein [Smithella sp.]
MPSSETNRNGFRKKIIIALLTAGVLLCAAFWYWQSGYNEDDVGTAQSIASNMSKNEIPDAEKDAERAAVSGTAVSGAVTQRPAYVTETEWQVLQNVAKQNQNVTLAHLVNKMLFARKKQAWLSAGKDTAERKLLARQLLDMIPGQLASEAMDAETAKEMKEQLQADVAQ